jgi:hypothetical protein
MSVESASRHGGTDGNEILTSATAVVLTLLLAVVGITLLSLRSLLSMHMFVGLLVIPPILLKLASTGYRFVRYYAGAGAYREKGPPLVWLRLLAPLLVATTIVVFGSGIALLVIGHHSDTLLTVHKASFIVWGVLFAVHFLAYIPRVVRSLASDWSTDRRHTVRGARTRLGLVLASVAGGVALAFGLLSSIDHWHRGGFG